MIITPGVDSCYSASANPAPKHPSLAGEVHCDVCVIGAGITGCSAALHLAERGYDVAVLESQRVGWGASGRSGGQLIFGFACDMSSIRRLVGRDDARRLWDMSVEALDLVQRQIAKYDISCDLRAGHLHAAVKPRHRTELIRWKDELEQQYGYEGTRLLQGDALRENLNTARYCCGLYDPRSGHLHPLNYTLGLAAAASSAGARYFEFSPAVRIDPGAKMTVVSPGGRVQCEHVLLCGNAYLDRLDPHLRKRVMPVGTYIVATEPLGEARARALIPNGMAVADMNFALDYFRLSGDNRMLFGGRVSYSTRQPRNLREAMGSRMVQVFPQLKDVRIEYAWGGFVAITQNRAPDWGRLGPGIYYAQGYSGHGMALAGLAGKLMAEAIAGTAERFDLFSKIPHRSFPGGRWFRTPALVVAMSWYRLRDLL